MIYDAKNYVSFRKRNTIANHYYLQHFASFPDYSFITGYEKIGTTYGFRYEYSIWSILLWCHGSPTGNAVLEYAVLIVSKNTYNPFMSVAYMHCI